MLLLETDIYKQVSNMELLDIFYRMARTISHWYITELFATDNVIMLYSIDGTVENSPCGLIYSIKSNNDITYVYIKYIATKYKYRKVGYASIFIREFIDYVKKNYDKNTIIVLDSLEASVTYYEHIGFKWILNNKEYNKEFNVNEEDLENGKWDHFIMEYVIQ